MWIGSRQAKPMERGLSETRSGGERVERGAVCENHVVHGGRHVHGEFNRPRHPEPVKPHRGGCTHVHAYRVGVPMHAVGVLVGVGRCCLIEVSIIDDQHKPLFGMEGRGAVHHRRSDASLGKAGW